MPENPEEKGTVEKSFFDQLNENKEKTYSDKSIIAPNSFSKITPANSRRGARPTGHYKDLNEDVGLDLFSDPRTWEQVGINSQSTLEAASDATMGFLINAGAGFVEGVAGNDLTGLISMAFGYSENRFGNILHDWANDMLEYTADNMHIYQEANASPFSFNYWGNQMQNFGYSVGIIGEMFAEMALLKKASGSSARLISAPSKFLSNPGVFGSFQGVKEAYLNGLQTGEQTYQKYLDIGYDKATAQKKANEAATLGFRMEALPLMVMNSLQFASLGKYNPFMKKGPNLGFSGGFETMSDYAFKGVKNKYIRKLADYGTNIIGEAIEEGIQTGISKEAQYQIGYADGLVNKKSLDERLFDDHEMRDSMIGGAMGGGMFRFMGKRVNTLTQGTEVKRQKADYEKFLLSIANRVGQDNKELHQAIQEGDQKKVDVIRKRMQRNNVLEALQYDMMNQDEKGFDTYVSSLNQMKEAITSGDLETMKSYGIESQQDLDHVTNNIETYISDAYNIKDKLISHLEHTDDFVAALQLTDTAKTIEELAEFEKRSSDSISEIKTNDKAYQSLTETGKKIFDLSTERASLLAKAKYGSITKEQRNRIDAINQELTAITEEAGSYEGKARDNALLKSMDATSLVKEYVNIYEMQDYQTELADRYSYWKDQENQKEERVKRAKKRVAKSKDKETLNQAKEDLQKEGELTAEVEEKINSKIKQEEIKEKANEGIPDTPFGNVVTPTQEEINPQKKEESKDNPLGNFVTPTEEELAPNKQRKDKANEIIDNLNIKKDGDSIIVNNDDLFEPARLGDFTDEQMGKLQMLVDDYKSSLENDLGKAPTFKEFIKDFIRNNSKESTERAYNALVAGWKANNFAETDFEQVYNDIFKDRASMTSDILNLAEDMFETETHTEVSDSNEKAVEKTIDKVSPTVELKETNNQPKVKDANPYRTSVPTLKAAHLSIPYKREYIEDEDGNITIVDTDITEELNKATDVKSNKLLDPNKYGVGTKLSVKVPENYREVMVKTWVDDFTEGPPMTFAEWMEVNGVEENSPEWIAKIPMVAVDSDGDAVFFIHDTDWYNPINVGFKDDLVKQAELITEARANLMAARAKVVETNSAVIEITDKRLGTIKYLDKSQPLITLNQANPHTQIAIATDAGELRVGKEFFETGGKELLNANTDFKEGHTYEIRKIQDNQYMAFKVFREGITPEVITSIKKAAEVYLFQYDDKELASNKAQIENTRNAVLKATGLDLFDAGDFESYLNLFVPVVTGSFSGVMDIYNFMEANQNVPEGTPYFSLQSRSLVFGVKGQPFSQKSPILFVNPRKVGDQSGPGIMKGILNTFTKVLPRTTQNISKKGLSSERKVALIGEDNQVSDMGTYTDFLKGTLKTNVKSFNVGTAENPVYATSIQPVINFKMDEAEPTKADKAKAIAEKRILQRPLTKEETFEAQENAKEVVQETKKARQEITVDEIETLQEALAILREQQVPDSDPSVQYILEKLGLDSDYQPAQISDSLVDSMKANSGVTGGLSILQESQLVDYIFNQITTKIDFKYKTAVGKNDLLKEIRESYFGLIEPKQESNLATIRNLKTLNEAAPNERMTKLIADIEDKVKVFDAIKENWKEFESKAMVKIQKYTGITEGRLEDKNAEDASTEQEKNYSKTSLEENGKTTASYRLKRFFSGISEVNADGKNKTGFLGIETYVPFDTVYSTIEQIISSPYEVDSNFDEMIVRLSENVSNFPWLQQVIDELKKADKQIQNEFVYNFARHTLSMKFVMFSQNRDGSYTLKAYDTNSNEINRVIKAQWASNFKQSSLTYVEDGLYKVNKARAKDLFMEFEKFQEMIEAGQIPATADLRNWLSNFGISLSNEAIEELKRKPVTYMTKYGEEKLSFPKMFRNTNKTAGIFGLLGHYLEGISRKEDTAFEENPENNPFDDISGVLNTLARIESKYSTFATTNSFRDGDKSIYGFTPTKHTTDVAKQLKYDQDFRDALLDKSFNKHSYMLQLLNSDPSFAEKFYIDHIGITALKELGKKAFGDNSITALSDSDHELTKLGLFQDLEQGEVIGSLGENNFVNFRIGRMFMPTMSDKSQMLAMSTAVLDLKDKHFIVNADNTVFMQSQLKEILYSQLVRPELERILKFASTVKKTNIKDYDMAAQMFLMVPEVNNIVDEKTQERALALMVEAPQKFGLEWFEAEHKDKVMSILENLVITEVNNKMSEWESSEFFTFDEETKTTTTKYFNNKYLKRFNGDNLTKVKLAAHDYVINNMLSNANVFMMIAGDIAMYSQGKINKYFQDGKPYLPKDDFTATAYSKAVKEVISVNVGKRLALMLAPGNKLANSKGTEYTQVFLNDHIDISSNIEYLVSLYYNTDAVNYAQRKIKQYNTATSSTERQAIAKDLSTKFPEIADYFDIEATDAQEYTTISEHVNVLEGQGRLSEEQADTIREKISQQLEAEKAGKAIPKTAMLNANELKLVLQPVKPVHTGFKNELRFDAMRMMYIKSSSFPLIPQVTKGTELDKLRRMLENFEEVKGKPVRASYQTANKVGAVSTAITPFNPDGTFNENITMDKLMSASLTLSRDNFRIQQDVPFKSDKRKSDTVSLGTQTLKLLFGDGMLDLDGFEFEGETYTGRDLQKMFNENFNSYITHKKQELYRQIGVDENGRPTDLESTMTKLRDLLKKEAEERGYPKQDVEALELVPTTDEAGNIVKIDFSVPLWLSPNSNRYEALLNAIVTNRLVNLKLPGNSFVVGSEAGFKMKSDLSGVNESRIIYTSKYSGEIKAAELNEDGTLKKAQIMVPSKFRNNQGELIELIDEKGNPNPTYAERDEQGVLRLKEGTIAEELLSVPSFRIPTSGHVSMSQLEIVGILPKEVGDLMIVPRNLTKQKGLDFDVDKETTYQLHTFVDENGNIKVLSEEDRQTILKAADSKNTADWNDGSPESNLLKAIFGEDPDFILEDIEEGTKLEKVNNMIDQKLMENTFVRIHNSVLSNPNPAIQQKINKVLSMDFAKSQAELVQGVTEENADDTFFTMLSDSFQKDKMFLGASGKLGIGVYSNYVVFHAMTQQIDTPVQLRTFDEEGKLIPATFTIGNQVSTGRLGLQTSLAKGKLKRNIAEAFAERQNTATDNEKEQIMGRLNVNEVTINVDALLTALGFDKDVLDNGTEVSLPYLLLSQPILKDYVAEIRKTKSNTVEYDANAEMKVINKLRQKYVVGNPVTKDARVLLTGQTLYNNLKEENSNNTIQHAVLDLFLEMKEYGKVLGTIQNRLNINSSGLGKSFFETIDKYKGLEAEILQAETSFQNISSLVGDYIEMVEVTSPERLESLLEEGYVQFEQHLIKPTTPVGSMLVHATNAGYNLWKDYFPYSDTNIRLTMTEILDNITNESTSSQKKIELQQDIFKEMKKYFVSSEKLGVFDGNPQALRKELFLDSENNTSLAAYLNDVVHNSDLEFLKNNKLISRFQYKIEKNGLPSLIKFDNSRGENFDEDYLYVALIELMEQNRNLPMKNGKAYSTRELAQDLIAYNFLEGGIQEAIQFSKYIPIAYLTSMPFASTLRKWDSKYSKDIYSSILGVRLNATNRFTKQYLQHNPQRLPKVDVDNDIYAKDFGGKRTNTANLMSFKIDEEKLTPAQITALGNAEFVAIYNPTTKKGFKKFQVYERNGDTFHRVSTLGTFGMSEYSIRENDVTSIVNNTFKTKNPSKAVKTQKEAPTDIFNLTGGDISVVLDNISNFEFKKYPQLANVVEALKEHSLNDLNIKIQSIVNDNGQKYARGVYQNGTVYVDSDYFRSADAEEIAKTVVHEVIHGMTSDYVKQYVDKDGNYLQDNVPAEIVNLVILFNEAKKHLGAEALAYKQKAEGQLLDNSGMTSTEREATVLYGATNIREFITLVMTEPNFQKEMSQVKYQTTNKSLLERFNDLVNSILQKVLGETYAKNSVTSEGIKVSLSLIEKQAEMKEKSKLQKMDDTNTSLESSLNNPLGNFITPTDEELNNFEDSDKNPTFEDPFKCK